VTQGPVERDSESLDRVPLGGPGTESVPAVPRGTSGSLSVDPFGMDPFGMDRSKGGLRGPPRLLPGFLGLRGGAKCEPLSEKTWQGQRLWKLGSTGLFVCLLGKRTVIFSRTAPSLPRKKSSPQSLSKYGEKAHLIYLGLDKGLLLVEAPETLDGPELAGTTLWVREAGLCIRSGVRREGLEGLDDGVLVHIGLDEEGSLDFEGGLRRWRSLHPPRELTNLTRRLLQEERAEEVLARLCRRHGLNVRYVVIRDDPTRAGPWVERYDQTRAALQSCGTCGIGRVCRAEFSLLVGARKSWVAWTGVLLEAPEGGAFVAQNSPF